MSKDSVVLCVSSSDGIFSLYIVLVVRNETIFAKHPRIADINFLPRKLKTQVTHTHTHTHTHRGNVHTQGIGYEQILDGQSWTRSPLRPSHTTPSLLFVTRNDTHLCTYLAAKLCDVTHQLEIRTKYFLLCKDVAANTHSQKPRISKRKKSPCSRKSFRSGKHYTRTRPSMVPRDTNRQNTRLLQSKFV